MEVGPLARVLVAFASGNAEVKELVAGALKQLDVPVTALFSTLGRTAARGLETKLVAGWSQEFYGQLLTNIKNGDSRMFNGENWDPARWPAEAKGVGMTEAPRGALAHWIVIKDKKIDNYQLVVPSTWNASPRDAKGQMSAYESALIGTPVKKSRTAPGSSPDHTLLRSLHRLCGAPVRREGEIHPPDEHLLGGCHGTSDNQRVYVWQWPVRFYHWINFLCVTVLCITGWMIGRPYSPMGGQEASFSYWFGTVRFLHFLAAFPVLF